MKYTNFLAHSLGSALSYTSYNSLIASAGRLKSSIDVISGGMVPSLSRGKRVLQRETMRGLEFRFKPRFVKITFDVFVRCFHLLSIWRELSIPIVENAPRVLHDGISGFFQHHRLDR